MPRNQTYTNTFCSPMPTRQRSDPNSLYEFLFNGKEKDSEINVNGGDFPMAIGIRARIYDSRLVRWLSLDPLQVKYPSFSAYNFCFNNPIFFFDCHGKVPKPIVKFLTAFNEK